METLALVKLRVGDRLWDFLILVDADNRLVVEPKDFEEFQQAQPDGMVVEVFDYAYVMYPFR